MAKKGQIASLVELTWFGRTRPEPSRGDLQPYLRNTFRINVEYRVDLGLIRMMSAICGCMGHKTKKNAKHPQSKAVHRGVSQPRYGPAQVALAHTDP